MKKVIILGASGHAKVIADIIARSGDRVVGFLDDNDKLPSEIVGFPLLGKIADCSKYEDYLFVIGIGNNSIRRKIAESYSLKWYTAVHPSAQIAMDTTVGEGTVIMANAVVNTSVKIGKHCIVNTGSVIEHDNVIGDYVHLSPNSTLCGTVHIGDMVHIGAGSTVINNLTLCSEVIIGAGSTVIEDINECGTYVGVPVRKIK